MSQPPSSNPSSHVPSATGHEGSSLDRIGEALRGLRYGTVTVIVHDGVVVQVDRTEKLRLTSPQAR